VKWLSSFLAILVLFLSVQPVCAASAARPQVDACCADDCSEDEGGDTHEKEDCKTCNPFQSCACCAGGVVMPQVSFSLRPMVPMVSAPRWGQPAPSASEASLSDFWQPPKRA